MECVFLIKLGINLVNSTIGTAEMAMALLTHVSFPFLESQTLSVKTGGTWPLETFLAFAKIYVFSPEALCMSDYY